MQAFSTEEELKSLCDDDREYEQRKEEKLNTLRQMNLCFVQIIQMNENAECQLCIFLISLLQHTAGCAAVPGCDMCGWFCILVQHHVKSCASAIPKVCTLEMCTAIKEALNRGEPAGRSCITEDDVTEFFMTEEAVLLVRNHLDSDVPDTTNVSSQSYQVPVCRNSQQGPPVSKIDLEKCIPPNDEPETGEHNDGMNALLNDLSPENINNLGSQAAEGHPHGNVMLMSHNVLPTVVVDLNEDQDILPPVYTNSDTSPQTIFLCDSVEENVNTLPVTDHGQPLASASSDPVTQHGNENVSYGSVFALCGYAEELVSNALTTGGDHLTGVILKDYSLVSHH